MTFICKFQVFYKTEFGHVYITGNTSEIGNWTEKGIKLNCTDNFIWKSPIINFSSGEFEYKYIVVSDDGRLIKWEENENRKIHILGDKLHVVNDFFGTQAGKVLTESEPLRVMTYNIRFMNNNDKFSWAKRKSEVALIINSSKPDLIGFQEALYQQVYDLCLLLPEYQYIGVGRNDGNRKGEFSPIFFKKSRFLITDSSTFWLSETPSYPSQSWDTACIRICSWVNAIDFGDINLTEISMYNTHLDHKSSDARIHGMSLILQTIDNRNKTKENLTFLTGDFNCTPEDKVISMVSEKLNNSQRVANKKVNENLATYTGWSTEVFGLCNYTIDYIFFSGNIIPLEYEIITEFDTRATLASDHRPVSCIFKYPEKPDK